MEKRGQKSFEISGEKPEESVKEEFIDTQRTPNVENLHLETEYRSPLIEILTPNKSRSRNNVTSPTPSLPAQKRPRLDPRLDESASFEPSGNPIGESTHLQETTQLPEPKGTYKFSIEKLKSFHQRQSSKLSSFEGRDFVANLTSSQAEDELNRKFNKEDFESLEVIGQFNKGFIIARLKDDLFIIDQHASDEKCNYEKFMTQPIEPVKLMVPNKLKLNPGDAEIIKERQNVFSKFGFKFSFDSNDDSVYLVESGKIGKHIMDDSDIYEIIYLLSEGEYNSQPSRIGRVNASRACRSSVMVGASLTNFQMKRILNNLANIKQPWNCPHGRPTMRHLANLNTL